MKSLALTLTELKNSESWRDQLAGRRVVIRSNSHGAWWREKAQGYTTHRPSAGVYDFGDAYARTRHCGPETRLVLQVVPSADDLTNIENDVLRGALGLRYAKAPFRNHFCAPVDGPTREACAELERHGFMERAAKPQASGTHFFYVTEEGARLIGHTLPSE